MRTRGMEISKKPVKGTPKGGWIQKRGGKVNWGVKKKEIRRLKKKKAKNSEKEKKGGEIVREQGILADLTGVGTQDNEHILVDQS